MKLETVLPFVFGLAIVVGLLAGTARPPTPDAAAEPHRAATSHASLQLSWVPDWLMTPLSRAIADATDPHARKAE